MSTKSRNRQQRRQNIRSFAADVADKRQQRKLNKKAGLPRKRIHAGDFPSKGKKHKSRMKKFLFG